MSSQETKSKRKPILMVSSALYGLEELQDRNYRNFIRNAGRLMQ